MRHGIRLLYYSNAVRQPKLHERARRGIERLLADRGIQPGTRIPAESQLARELYVSLTTIRTALKALEQEAELNVHLVNGSLCDNQFRSVLQLRPRDEAARFDTLTWNNTLCKARGFWSLSKKLQF